MESKTFDQHLGVSPKAHFVCIMLPKFSFFIIFVIFHAKMGKWNVTPLLGHFGGRVGICSFLQSPPLLLVLPCLSLLIIYSLFFPFQLVSCMLACPRACNKCMHPTTKGKEKRVKYISLNIYKILYQGFERGNSLYQKLWNYLENRENGL